LGIGVSAPILSAGKHKKQKEALTDIRINAHDVGGHHEFNVKALVPAGDVQTNLVEGVAALVSASVTALASVTSNLVDSCLGLLVISSGCAGRRESFSFQRVAAWRLIVEPLNARVVVFEFHFRVLLHDYRLHWLLVYVVRELTRSIVVEVEEFALMLRRLALHRLLCERRSSRKLVCSFAIRTLLNRSHDLS
jgi:hypothetical protein